MKTAFIQSVGGASGDMLLGALLDAGLSPDAVQESVDALGIDGVDIATETETRCEVRGRCSSAKPLARADPAGTATRLRPRWRSSQPPARPWSRSGSSTPAPANSPRPPVRR